MLGRRGRGDLLELDVAALGVEEEVCVRHHHSPPLLRRSPRRLPIVGPVFSGFAAAAAASCSLSCAAAAAAALKLH